MRLTNPDMVRAVTSNWKGKRDASGRPIVPDSIVKRMELVTTEEAWGTLREHGYEWNFCGGWMSLHADQTLVGRALTSRWVPQRPDINSSVNAQGQKDGRVGHVNSWVIDELKPNDVMVVDHFGKVRYGPFIGDNLSTSIWTKTGRGFVIEGTIRDTQRILEIEGLQGYYRGMDPSFIRETDLVEINGIIRMGEATCVPGDIVLGTLEGIIFIPPHLAEEVVVKSEDIRVRDEFGKQMLAEGRYTPGEIDRKWEPHIERHYQEWLSSRGKATRKPPARRKKT